MKPFLSVCTILKNEERFLREFIESYSQIADEFILVDTGSTDKSLDIINSFGISPYHFKWINDFGKARSHSLNLANGKWICVADADDRITRDDALKIKSFLKNCDSHAVIVPYTNLNDFNWNSKSPNILNTQDRMVYFQNHLGIEYRGAIHENPMLSIQENNYSTCTSDIPVYHLGYAQELLSEKSERNAKLIEMLYNEGVRESHIVYHYCNLHWSQDQSIYEDLTSALESSGVNRKYTILESICQWLYDFRPQAINEINNYLKKLCKLKKNSKTLILFQARDMFLNNKLDQSLHLYQQMSTLQNTKISSRYQFEIHYRITFLLAAKGLLEEAVQYSSSFTEYLKVNEFFHLRIKLLASLGDIENIKQTLRCKPSNLSLLDSNKLNELKQILHHFKISL